MTENQPPVNPPLGVTKAGQPVHRRRWDHLPASTSVQKFNKTLAIRVTDIVGSMWCAYAFALFDILSLPNAIKGGTSTIVSWVAQTFLQLVLLSVIMVGQKVQGDASDARSTKTLEYARETRAAQAVTADDLNLETEGGLKAVLDEVKAGRADTAKARLDIITILAGIKDEDHV